ncbi:MAG TPA: GntR family transcriptional regulator [Streptosporangiaceae bacterium]|nr:GntR family transcriptional regulator [Streptosporangiaceae bacterium]
MPDNRPMSARVRDQLIELFHSRRLGPGDRVPSEAEIADLCGVGRSTAREALKLLEQDGLVIVERGRGRFLSSLSALHIERPITRFESVTSLLQALGFEAKTLVLSVTEDRPTGAEREALGLGPEDSVIRLERLRSSDDDPIVYSVDTIPRDCIPGPVKHVNWAGSLNDLLAAHGHLMVSSAARLQAVDLPQEAQDRYQMSGFGPWLLITETAVTTAGTHILYAQDYHRGSIFAFNVLRR